MEKQSEKLKKMYEQTDIPVYTQKRIQNSIFKELEGKSKIQNSILQKIKSYLHSYFSQEITFSNLKPVAIIFTIALVIAVLDIYYVTIYKKETGQNKNLSVKKHTEKQHYISFVKGSVTIKNLKSNKTVKKNNDSIISLNDTISTNSTSYSELNIFEHKITLNENSSLKINSINKENLLFQLDKGTAVFFVKHLNQGEFFKVKTDSATIEVIGTQFTVYKKDNCAGVKVNEGVVKVTSTSNKISLLKKESKQLFCLKNLNTTKEETLLSNDEIRNIKKIKQIEKIDKNFKIKKQENKKSNKSISKNLINKKVVKNPKIKSTEKISKKGPDLLAMASKPLNKEEKLYKEAHHTFLLIKNLDKSKQLFVKYLSNYPDGVFVEESNFHLIRINYKLGNKQLVYNLAKNFLTEFKQNNQYIQQVTVIYAQTMLELNKEPKQVISLLNNYIQKINTFDQAFAEQIIYLYAVSWLRIDNCIQGNKWLSIYLKRFPNGIYVKTTSDYIKSLEKSCN